MTEERVNELLASWVNGNRKFVVTEIRTKGTPADCAEFVLKLIAFKQNQPHAADAETFVRMLGDYERLSKKEKDNWKFQGHCVMDDGRS